MVIGTQGFMTGMPMNRGLIRFDVSGIPSGAVINSATLQLTVRMSPNTNQIDFALHRLLRSWSEGGSTWDLRLPPDQMWDAPGGAADADYAAAVSGGASIAGVGAYTFASTAAMIADVTEWIANPAANHGWLVKQVDESISPGARRFNASEATAGAPQLVVEYSEPPSLVITMAGISNNEFCLTFRARAGKSYRLDRRARLDSGDWGTVTTLPPQGSDGPVTLCDPVGAGSAYYRVVEL